MKFFMKKNSVVKRIILTIMLGIILLTNYSYAKPNADEIGGALFNPICDLICEIGDLIMQGCQKYFIGFSEIADKTSRGDKENFKIRYSPGIIFSGKVAALDVNFIEPNEFDTYINDKVKYEDITSEAMAEIAMETYGLDESDSRLAEIAGGAIEKLMDISGEAVNLGWYDLFLSHYNYWEATDKSQSQYDKSYTGITTSTLREHKISWTNKDDGKKYMLTYIEVPNSENEGFFQKLKGTWQSIGMAMKDGFYMLERQETIAGQKIDMESSAKTLRKTVSTWYLALRAIALVGLLSVLVYIGIRILISSTSQEKAKYKKMIIDWVAAICILFVLQYIMAFTLEVSEKITETLSVNIVGPEGEDTLISGLRNEVNASSHFSEMFAELIMYIVLVIYTVVFTFQYLKRLLYMAFFTMIAPLIALTYPLDKIKDGQAQAFGIWIREYIFNALIQPVHLLLYYIFVSSAVELVDANKIYAIVAIGFLIPAEKFFRKMFGFDKASSVSPVGAAAGGALIMNAINKMGHRSGKQAAGKGNSGGSGDSGSGGTSGSTPRYASIPDKGIGGGKPKNLPKDKDGNPIGAAGSAFGQSVAAAPKSGKINLRNGGRTLAGHYNPFNKPNATRNAKALGRGARKLGVGALGAATLGTVGLAAGVATGDLGNALKYGAAGVGAGYMGANYVGDKATDLEKKNREMFKEGAFGTEEYNRRNSIKELTNDRDFNNYCKTMGVKNQKGREVLIRQFHENGITKAEDIKKAMNAGANTGATRDQVMAAAKIRREADRLGYKKKDVMATISEDKAKDLVDLMW